MPAFPLLQRPRLDLSVVPQDTRLRTNVAAGPPKMRRRFTAAIRTWTFTLGPITGAEKASLETFYTTTTTHGTTSFTWPDETGTVQNFRFAAPPTYRIVVGHNLAAQRKWEVALVLEILPG